MERILAFFDLHPLMAVAACGVIYLALLVFAKPLPEEPWRGTEWKGDGGLPEDWPR